MLIIFKYLEFITKLKYLTIVMKKHYYILYGYNRDIFLDIYTNQITKQEAQFESVLLLVEPRGNKIEEFKKDFKTSANVILESKLIVSGKSELSQYLYKKNEVYSIETIPDYEKREQVYCINFSKLMDKYNIQNVCNFIITFNLLNISELLKEFFLYHHFISAVQLHNAIKFDLSNSFIESSRDQNTVYYTNRNLDIDLPNICLYIIDYPDTQINKTKLLQMVKQYDITLLYNEELLDFEQACELIENNSIKSKEKFNISILQNNISSIIKKKYYDIIVQFNTKYFESKPFFQLMYPLKENVLYINQGLDIIYGTGRTMYKLYDMMYSEEFKEYINLKKQQKGKVYHFFEKRYFYEYLLTQFTTITL
jgi:hypothetical protein